MSSFSSRKTAVSEFGKIEYSVDVSLALICFFLLIKQIKDEVVTSKAIGIRQNKTNTSNVKNYFKYN